MKSESMLCLAAAVAMMAGCAEPGSDTQARSIMTLPDVQSASPWFVDGQQAVQAGDDLFGDAAHGRARNVILFVGDGMGISTVTAARILAGQRAGNPGEEHRLSFEYFPVTGLMKTYNTNQQTPDSAGTMTAMATGVKTRAGVIAVDEHVRRGDCDSSKGKELLSVLELAESHGKATGMVTTARVTHATPAATYAKSPERDWESDDALPETAREAGCRDIAAQLVSFDKGDGIEVVMGGGRRHFLPREEGGRRNDGRHLIREWQQAYPQGHYVDSATQLEGVPAQGPLLGLFASSHMAYEAQRQDSELDQPSLSAMTALSLERLSDNKNGYFLMVEAGRIDHGHHAGSAFNALNETVEFSEAVRVAMENTDPRDTLIIVTADHSHVFTIAGYPTRGNPILGKVVGNNEHGEPESEPVHAADDRPYTTLGYMNGPGFAQRGAVGNPDERKQMPVNAGRQDLSGVNTRSPGYHQESLVPMMSETHAGEDVGVWARGPGALLLSGTHEQNVIFHVMARAAGLLPD